MRELFIILMSIYGYTGEYSEIQKGYTEPSGITHPFLKTQEAHTHSAEEPDSDGVDNDGIRCPCGACNCVSGHQRIIFADRT